MTNTVFELPAVKTEPSQLDVTITFNAQEIYNFMLYIQEVHLNQGYNVHSDNDLGREFALYLATGKYTKRLTKWITAHNTKKQTLY